MLHMEEVRRVMRPKVMCHIRQQAWCLIACRLDYLTVETDKGLFHEFLPGVLIACLCRLLQQNIVAHGLDTDEAQTARKGFIVCQRDCFRRHFVSQPLALFAAVRHDCFFNATVDLLLGSVRGPHKSIEARDLQEQAHQANPAGAHFGTDQVDRQDQSMQEGESQNAVKKCYDSGTRVQALVHPPCLKRATGHVERLGRLTLGEALGLQIVILLKALRAFNAIPALVAIIAVALCILDDCAHSYLLFQPFALMRDGSGWRDSFLVSTLRGVESLIVWGGHRDQVADAVIKAGKSIP
jgi:hypothetical protein